MQELYNQLQAATNPLEIINLSDKILDKKLTAHIKLMFLKGDILLSLERFDEAISVFKRILEYDDSSFAGRAHNSLGFCYSMKNEYNNANSEFEKARKYCDKQSLLVNSAALNLITYYSMTDQKENTYEIFKELYDLDSFNGNNDTHILLSVTSNPEELLQVYDINDLESYNADVNVLFAKGDALVELERFDDALPVFKEILKYINIDDKDIAGKTYTALGICYFRRNELNKALSGFEKAREYSDDSLILYNLASTYVLTNQKEKALEVYKEMSNREPYNQDVKKIIELLELELNRKDQLNDNNFNSIQEALMQADIYSKQKEYEKAIEVYDSITEVMPEQPPAWNKKGYAYYQLGRYGEAMKCYDKALEYNPNSAPSMFYKSLIYINLEDFENAEDMIVKALRIIPNNAEFLNNYCAILNRLGKYEEAIDAANKALIIDPDSFETYTNKAYALEKFSRFDEALECYDKALKINPNFFEAWYNKTYALENLNRFEEALECYDKALEINPNMYEIWENKANALRNLKKYNEAIECYKKALTLSPNNSSILGSMSLTYAVMGDMDNALKCINSNLEENPDD